MLTIFMEQHAHGPWASPASEWLLDNFHIIKAEILSVAESIPQKYYLQLPKLSGGPHRGYPRVYELSLEFVSGTTGVMTMDALESFTLEYQRITLLTMGELWALPSMLRLALLGNIWRTTKRTMDRLTDIMEADRWAERIMNNDDHDSLRTFITEHPPLDSCILFSFL